MTPTPDVSGVLDETYERMRSTGPEFDGWLSNHGPMAADALIRIGREERVPLWREQYAARLEAAPDRRWALQEDDWREHLGDASRLGDWIALFERQLAEERWQGVLVRWWPRLVDGAVASATHGLIRTGHVVRALREHPTGPRVDELAQALGYWAARHQRLPAHPRPGGVEDAVSAMSGIGALETTGGITERLRDLADDPTWPRAVQRLRTPQDAAGVPAAVDALVDAAVSRYRDWAHGNPVMLVHAATAPRAAGLVLPVLPQELWLPTFEAAWACTAAVSGVYRPATAAPRATADEVAATTPDDVVDRAVDSADEHAIKFVEVALESHGRGNADAVPAAARAAHLISPPAGS